MAGRRPAPHIITNSATYSNRPFPPTPLLAPTPSNGTISDRATSAKAAQKVSYEGKIEARQRPERSSDAIYKRPQHGNRECLKLRVMTMGALANRNRLRVGSLDVTAIANPQICTIISRSLKTINNDGTFVNDRRTIGRAFRSCSRD